mmetsp:Transcript_101573/g.291557  ORF Transcript_101573/g.291557 Transcript_101573/m.291557 type:complete len:310 (+) Transcript_101573:84-1013(+)
MSRSRFEASRVQIIFAEDDCVFREIATPAIERVGIPEQSIQMADHGEEALECLERLQSGDVNEPIIMLLDMRMPVMDGDECAKKVKELHDKGNLRRIPYLVCCTAGVTKVTFGGEDGEDETFHLTMPKPFSNKEVQLVLENAEKWWATGGTMVGSPPVEEAVVPGGGSAGTDSSSGGRNGSKRLPFDVRTVELIIVDDEPICRMALVTALTLQGIVEDQVVECDRPSDIEQALKDAQRNQGVPLMMLLAQERWAKTVHDLGSLERKPFLVCAAVLGASDGTGFDAVLPSGFQHSDLKLLLGKFQSWWAR